jgi:hypothetical protein
MKPVHPAAQINQIGGPAGRDRISAVAAHIERLAQPVAILCPRACPALDLR